MFRSGLFLPFAAFLNVLAAFPAAVAASAASEPAVVREVPGPVPARVIRVIDGDTVLVDATPWPGHSVRVSVRLRGIDAPEIRSRCTAIRDAGLRARAALAELLGGPEAVTLRNIGGGKYYGRILADLAIGEVDTADILLSRGLVGSYDGGRRDRSPCPTE